MDTLAGVPEGFRAKFPLQHRLAHHHLRNSALGVDILSVIVETGARTTGCVDYDVVTLMDRFVQGELRKPVPGVQSMPLAPSYMAKIVNAGYSEGSLKWRILPRNPGRRWPRRARLRRSKPATRPAQPRRQRDAHHDLPRRPPRAETLLAVTVCAVKAFSTSHPSPKAKFLLASGNAGVMAATNEVVRAAEKPILYWVFGAVIALCLVTFRSSRATLCIVVPLVIVSYLAYALMVYLGIGLKTSTLPVVALGVGIGVDCHGIYLGSRGYRPSLKAGR